MRQFKTKPTGRPRTRPVTDYGARHYLVSTVRGKASGMPCLGYSDRCEGEAAQWATLHGHSGADPYLDYVPMCRLCHAAYDYSPARNQKISAALKGRSHPADCNHCRAVSSKVGGSNF